MAYKVNYVFKGIPIVGAHVRIDEITIKRRKMPDLSWAWRVNAVVRIFANKNATQAERYGPDGYITPSPNDSSVAELRALEVSFMWDRQETPGVFNAIEAYLLALPEFSTAENETD